MKFIFIKLRLIREIFFQKRIVLKKLLLLKNDRFSFFESSKRVVRFQEQ